MVSDFLRPMNCSTPGLPVHHQLPEFTHTHVRRVSDAIQPSHPLSSPSPPAPNPSQHQGLFQWVNSASGGQSIGVSASASFLTMNTQDWFPLGLVEYPCSPRDSQESSPTCKSKLQWRIISHWSEWPSSKCLQTINSGESTEKMEPSYTVGTNINWYSCYGE